MAFKQRAERTFDRAFDYDRELKETFKYANTLKHGDYGPGYPHENGKGHGVRPGGLGKSLPGL